MEKTYKTVAEAELARTKANKIMNAHWELARYKLLQMTGATYGHLIGWDIKVAMPALEKKIKEAEAVLKIEKGK